MEVGYRIIISAVSFNPIQYRIQPRFSHIFTVLKIIFILYKYIMINNKRKFITALSLTKYLESLGRGGGEFLTYCIIQINLKVFLNRVFPFIEPGQNLLIRTQ